MKIRLLTSLFIASTILLARAQSYNITNFANDPAASVLGDWSLTALDGTTSSLTGNNSIGNLIYGGSGTFSYAGATHISITGSANNTSFPNSSFLFILNGLVGNSALAVFSWDQLGSGTPAVSPLTSLGSLDLTQLINWEIVSLYPNNQPAGPVNIQLVNMSAVGGALPSPGIAGPLVSGANSFVLGTNQSTNNIGAFTGGSTALQNYSGATQISLTANATLEGSNGLAVPFTYVLIDNTGAQAYAAFDWQDFSNGAATVTSPIVPDGFFDPGNVVSWQIVLGPNGQQVPSNYSVATVNVFGVAAVSPTQTDTVVDDFSVGVSQFQVSVSNALPAVSSNITIAGYTNSLRQIENTITGSANPNAQATVQVADDNYLLVTTETQDTDNTITYSGFSIYATEQHFLRFDFNSVQNLDELQVFIGTESLGAVSGIFAVPDSLFASSSFFIDLSLHPNWEPAFASGINFLNVTFGTASGNMLVELDQITFTSIPQPSTFALLLMGGALAFSRSARKRRLE